MKARVVIACISLMVSLLVLTSCGPSPDEIAAMTEASWTATPTNTPIPPTATPIPYGISLLVTDGEGNPVEGATVTFLEISNTLDTDSSGTIALPDYGGETLTASIDAQGYIVSEHNVSLERGPNEITMALERDPFGLLPSEACAPGETQFAVYDFEDGTAAGWPEIEAAAQGWSFVPNPDTEENTVLQLQASGDDNGSARMDFPENFAWRLWVRAETRVALSLTPSRTFTDEGPHFYQIILSTGEPNPSELRKLQLPDVNVGVRALPTLRVGDWAYFEISRYGDTIEVWRDGELAASYQDPNPIAATGFVGISIFAHADPSTVLIDNMSVCELNSAFSSMSMEAHTE